MNHRDYVFISYVREDREMASRLYEDLKKAEVNPWIDYEDILAGQRWKEVIDRVIVECSAYFLALFSKTYNNKTGYAQSELRKAIEFQMQCPVGKIYIIPIKIDNCKIKDQHIKGLHYVKLFNDYEAGLKAILKVIKPKVDNTDQKNKSYIILQHNDPIKSQIHEGCGLMKKGNFHKALQVFYNVLEINPGESDIIRKIQECIDSYNRIVTGKFKKFINNQNWYEAEKLIYQTEEVDKNRACDLMDNLLNTIDMVFIPAGFFKKGIHEHKIRELLNRRTLPPIIKRILNKCRESKIFLDAYYIDKYPVTNQQFAEFIKQKKYKTVAERELKNEKWYDFYTQEKENHPVVCVTLKDAKAYAKWAEKELPSADQWEKAARGPYGQAYPWDNSLTDDFPCNTIQARIGETTSIDTYDTGKSPYGVYDMVGNVSEWTNDIDENGLSIVMGGSYLLDRDIWGLPAFRYGRNKDRIRYDIGFRCTRKAFMNDRPYKEGDYES